jgi:hypothetical protein
VPVHKLDVIAYRICNRVALTADFQLGVGAQVIKIDAHTEVVATAGHKADITSRVYMSLGESSKRAAVDAVEQLIAGKPAHT